MASLRHDTNETTYKAETDSQTWRTDLRLSKGRGLEGKDWEVGTSRCELLDLAGVPSVPSPRATDWCWSVACQELGHAAGGECGRVSKAPSIFAAAPHRSCYCLNSTSCQISNRIINVIHPKHPALHPPPSLWKNCLPQNEHLVPKRMGTADMYDGYTRHYCIAQGTTFTTLSANHDGIEYETFHQQTMMEENMKKNMYVYDQVTLLYSGS